MVWKRDNPEGNETAKMRWELVPYTRGHGYDLGCGNCKGFPHFVGMDNRADEQLFGAPRIVPDIQVATCERLPMIATHGADFIFSSHLLEHIKDYAGALKDWWRVVKPGGHLCLYLPHKNFYPNMGEPGSNPDHKHDFLPEDIVEVMKTMTEGWDLVENQERNGGTEYSFFQVYRKLGHRTFRRSCDEPKPEKTCGVVRYGAYGDLLMASSVFPGLKEQGYHITLYLTPRGLEAVSHDPHVDRVVIQDNDQVPNGALGDYWEYIAKKYDKFINLSESVEGTFLALPDRAQARFSHAARHRVMNVNYLEFAHDLAGVPMVPAQRFYATPEEKAWAKRERSKIGGDYVIMWSLSGSSVHKHWPHMDEVIARLLIAKPGLRVVMVGDDACRILEQGWENEARILRRSGVWSIRQSLAFLEQCDMVIGPETGVLNAAALMPMPKVIFLSHSSVENLTKHWVNTTSLEPTDTPCYPCHMMHYGFQNCREGFMDINGEKMRVGALCQVNIRPEVAWDAIVPHLAKQEAA